MTNEEATARVLDALNSVGVPYMLVGSLSSSLYGIARTTHDADFVLGAAQTPIAEIMDRLGPKFRLEPQVTFETVTGTRRYLINVVESSFRIELFLLSDEDHDQERFARRRETQFLGQKAFIPTPEDVIITKLRWSSRTTGEKDIVDVRGVIAVQHDRLDWSYIESWCDRDGTRELLDEIRRSLPPVD